MSCLTWSKFIQSPFAIQWCLYPLLVFIPNYSLFQYFCTKNVWHFPYVSFLNGLPVYCFQRWKFDTQLVVASMNITTQDFVDGLWWPTVINTLVSISILLRSSAFHQKHYCLSLPPDVPCYYEKYRVTCYWLASKTYMKLLTVEQLWIFSILRPSVHHIVYANGALVSSGPLMQRTNIVTSSLPHAAYMPPGTEPNWAGCLTTELLTPRNIYRETSNKRHTLIGNKIVDHSDVVGASPVGAAPTTSSFST